MSNISFTLLAQTDMIFARNYVAQGGVAAALKWLDKTENLCESILQFPELGRLRPEIGPGIRSFVSGVFVLLYVIKDDGIEVERVVHGSRDISHIILGH